MRAPAKTQGLFAVHPEAPATVEAVATSHARPGPEGNPPGRGD